MLVERVTLGERGHAPDQLRPTAFEFIGLGDRDELASLSEVIGLNAARRERAGADP